MIYGKLLGGLGSLGTKLGSCINLEYVVLESLEQTQRGCIVFGIFTCLYLRLQNSNDVDVNVPNSESLVNTHDMGTKTDQASTVLMSSQLSPKDASVHSEENKVNT